MFGVKWQEENFSIIWSPAIWGNLQKISIQIIKNMKFLRKSLKRKVLATFSFDRAEPPEPRKNFNNFIKMFTYKVVKFKKPLHVTDFSPIATKSKE